LKSLEIEEKINKIKWCRRTNYAHFLLSTNGKYNTVIFIKYTKYITIDKTIKLWKVFERNIKVAHEYDNNVTPRNGLFIPKISHQDNIVAAIPRKIYANGKCT
jgi:serine/threonine-protein phosphatase 2A regulatory subunit B